ncbi:hypothetical protein B0H66DRAFT_558615 [Apodospora peruviana]|uniref:Uncharacterized protein n=1 Tax=Apodospora peruviana TaxID=516989 RepID=A0AAE0I5U9_9PEZI|nr:hypothetical protein B0H66DRAFT_558615 [Apodospora peruviana]
MPPANKSRVYVCLYYQPGATSLNPPRFHWGLWVEPKNSGGQGDYFHVQYRERMNTENGVQEEGWYYDSTVQQNRPGRANYKNSSQLIGRVLIGKLAAPGTTAQQVDTVLAAIQVPQGNETCKDWTGRAAQQLQTGGLLDRQFPWTGAGGCQDPIEVWGRQVWTGTLPGREEKYFLNYFNRRL